MYGYVNLIPMLLHFGSVLAVSAPIVLPKPNGNYGVSLNNMELIDYHRTEPFPPHASPRRIMVSAFYPSSNRTTCQTEFQSYMPPATAAYQDEVFAFYGLPNHTVSRVELSLCKAPARDMTKVLLNKPIILFSPGLGNSRLLYSFLAESVASEGYIVVTIDHPQDAGIVEFPDGKVIMAANISDEKQILQALAARVADVQFVLDSLSNHSVQAQLFNSSTKLMSKPKPLIGIFGHSLGGATALSAMLKDPRLTAGLNLDGSFWGNATTQATDTTRPFLLYGHDGANQSTDPTWKKVWPALKGWKLELELLGSQHGAFEDLPILIDVLGFGDLPPTSPLRQTIGQFIGKNLGLKAMRMVSDVVVAYFDFALKGKPMTRVNEVVKKYKEIQVIASGGGASTRQLVREVR